MGYGVRSHTWWTLIELIDLVLHVIKRFANAFDMPHTHNTHFNWWNRKWKIMEAKEPKRWDGERRSRGWQLNCVHSELFGCRSHTTMCHLGMYVCVSMHRLDTVSIVGRYTEGEGSIFFIFLLPPRPATTTFVHCVCVSVYVMCVCFAPYRQSKQSN